MKRSGWLRFGSTVIAICTALLIIAGAIAVPILWRGLYYRLIPALAQQTGYSQEVIRKSYDAVMNYLVRGAPFSTGTLRYSMDGQSHFADCLTLFRLDFGVVTACGAVLILMMILAMIRRKKGLQGFSGGHLPVFWSAVCSVGAFLVLGIWGMVDFYSLFVVFHRVFFPGKSNWVFDPTLDEVINILPESYFTLCGAVIACVIFFANLCCLLADVIRQKKKASR